MRNIWVVPWWSRSQHDLSAKLFPAHNFVIWSRFNFFSHEWSPYWDDVSSATFRLLPWRSRSHYDLSAKSFPAHNFFYLKSNFTTILQEWSPHWDNVLRASFGLLPWRPISQHDLVAKSCMAQNLFEVGFYNNFWQTTSLRPIPIRGASPGSDRLLCSHMPNDGFRTFEVDYLSNNISIHEIFRSMGYTVS